VDYSLLERDNSIQASKGAGKMICTEKMICTISVRHNEKNARRTTGIPGSFDLTKHASSSYSESSEQACFLRSYKDESFEAQKKVTKFQLGGQVYPFVEVCYLTIVRNMGESHRAQPSLRASAFSTIQFEENGG